MKITSKGKIVLIVLVAVAGFFGIRWYQSKPKQVGDAATFGKVSIPDAPEASLSGTAAVKLALPSTAKTNKPNLVDIDWWMMAWQSQNPAIYANGGAETTEGSLIENAGVNLHITRQDDCNASTAQMLKYVQDYKDGNTKKGFFITFMGSGIPNYFRGLYTSLEKLGPEYAPVVFLTFGKSYGEDQVIGTRELKENKQLLRGKVLRGVKLDGDIDLALKLCFDNNIPVNADPNLYYRDALNLSYASTYLTAVDDYNSNKKETRKVVEGGRTTGKDTTVGIDLVATWTPGDERAINGRGGVTIISTKEYASIMPNITITCKKFLNDNRETVVKLIGALAQAGDQIRTFEDIKKYSCKLGAVVWNEQDGDWWYRLYNGVKKDGDTRIGGSMAFNLNDIANTFGLNNNRDIYKDVYNTFGTLQSKLYPADLPNYIDYAKVVDKSFVRAVMDAHPELLEGKALKVDYTQTTGEVVGSKSYSIQFETGSATIKSSSYDLLEQIAEQINASEGLKVVIEGHSDNVGSEDINKPLSEKRAQAVVEYLERLKIDSDRFRAIGYGSSKPLNPSKDQNSAAVRSENRRVQIILEK